MPVAVLGSRPPMLLSTEESVSAVALQTSLAVNSAPFKGRGRCTFRSKMCNFKLDMQYLAYTSF